MNGPASGLRLERPDRDRLLAAATAAFPGFVLREFARVRSTQDVVRAAAIAGADEGFCCVAAEQTDGRGRQGRSWNAPPGSSLTTSVLLWPVAAAIQGVAMAAGLAVAAGVSEVSGATMQVKWPNDILAGGGKLAGILAEAITLPEGTAVVLGVGVNLTVETFPADVNGVSLHRLCQGPLPPWNELLAAMLTSLSARLALLATGGLPALLPEWTARATGLGAPVEADTPAGRVAGIATGVDIDGALLVDTTGGGTLRLIAGDVHLVTAPTDVSAAPRNLFTGRP